MTTPNPIKPPNAPVEAKVVAATSMSAAAGFVVSLLVTVLPGLSQMAPLLQAAVIALLTAGSTFLAGYLAKHTPRLGDKPASPTVPSPHV